ncbi:hypothetical protein QTP70_004000 [Hemibagrus guttatus]|uniref:Reverse transcriptase/retrotransposon-derived protein RNase H-like domain-containing protein n=1 Tax=Hemibagrus guttatus TaxID=175788 RepID=A0AAE0Q912_9TELE|nr:hypothetical protein QTP70_004000 [Hemibagrus guttatus]KAK3541822.1 hypothetical protein QTP86_005771 [Hemibagrus guttatus]
MAPILTLPDPSRQFVVKVDASDLGVGAVLSQLARKDNCLHPCAFSHCLSPAEKKYAIGKRELLAVKLARRSGDTGWKVQSLLSYGQTAET